MFRIALLAVCAGIVCAATLTAVQDHNAVAQRVQASKAYDAKAAANELARCKAGTTSAIIVQGVHCKA